MKISYKHIVKSIEEKPSINELSNILFQLGHEHEIENENFLMEITPNRGDCLSLDGILRDIRHFYTVHLERKIYENDIEDLELDFDNQSIEFCPKISFLKIEIDKNISEYKNELKDYFEDLEIDKKNFFTDISNYVMYETGQPTHCYDAKKIKSGLSLRQINKDIDFVTLLSDRINSVAGYREIKLSGKNQVFMMGDEIINLAGIVGGENTCCSPLNETTSILLECAYFCPEQILGKSVAYDINSDAAHKFERGVDITSHERVIRRFINIVEEHATIKDIKIFTMDKSGEQVKKIPLDLTKINKVLGISISEDDYLNYLKSLGFSFKDEFINVPSYRNDINTQNDLAEEVARLIGYDNIPTKKINISNTTAENNDFENKIKAFLIDHGFYEVINSPFVDPFINPIDGQISTISKEAEEIRNNSILVDNPLDTSKCYLRDNISHSLMNNMIYNERRQKDSIKFFEISDIYSINNEKLANNKISSNRKLSILASGRVGNNYKDFSKKINVKYMNNIFKKTFPNKHFTFRTASRDKMVPNSKSKSDVVYIEINLNDFPKDVSDYQEKYTAPIEFKTYVPVSEFPSSKRDISYLIKDASKINIIQDIIFSYDSPIIKEIFIFDYYENMKTQEIKIGFRFIFQSKKTTLTDNEVNNEMKMIISDTTSIDSVSIPGL